MTVSRGAGIVLLGIVSGWLIAPAGSRSLAQDYLVVEEVPRPMPTEESTLISPHQSDVLDLLESDDTAWTDDPQTEYQTYGQTVYREEGSFVPPSRLFWMRGEYLLFWTNGTRLPALVMTGPDAGPPPVLGDGNPVLFGNSEVNREGRSNFRVRAGYWLDDRCRLAMEGEYFDSTGRSTSFSDISSGVPVLVRPIYDTQMSVAGSEPIAYPAVSVGFVDSRAADYYQSTGLWLRRSLLCMEAGYLAGCCEDESTAEAGRSRRFRLDFVGGYRFHRFTDSVSVVEHTVTTAPPPPVATGTMFSVVDSFRASNEFNGGELGLVSQLKRGRWSFELTTKMAMGNNHQIVQISGSTAITTPGQATINYNGGLLALPTNIGTYIRNDFVVIPQCELEIGYQLTRGLRAYAGYNFLYWTDVTHAADQIDLNVDPRNIPPAVGGGGPEPAFTSFHRTSFWAQGFTAGFELRY